MLTSACRTSRQVHCDELYVPEGEGFVSRAVANLMLNMACNERLLPRSEIARHVSEESV